MAGSERIEESEHSYPSLLPNKQPWNYDGFANNMVQRIPVEVRSPIG